MGSDGTGKGCFRIGDREFQTDEWGCVEDARFAVRTVHNRYAIVDLENRHGIAVIAEVSSIRSANTAVAFLVMERDSGD